MKNDYLAGSKKSSRRVGLSRFSNGFSLSLDESILPFNTGRKIENFDYSSGALKEGYGLTSFSVLGENIKSIWCFSKYNFDTLKQVTYLMCSTKNGEVFYSLDGGVKRKLEGITLVGDVMAINYRLYEEDVILMYASEGMFVWDGINSPIKIEGAPDITSLTIHYERMFVTEGGQRNAVRFSDDLDPTNWSEELDEGGYIRILDERGKLNKVISFINYVYIFRDYGITRLVAYADQTEFSTSNLFVSAGKIYPKTVAVCGDRVVFLAGDGVYEFDGVSTARVLPQLERNIDYSPDACAVYHDGKYVLSARLIKDGDESKENNALIVYDLKLRTVSILTGECIEFLASINERCFAVNKDGQAGILERSGEVFGVATKKSWESGFIDFDTPQKKVVREVSVDCDCPFDLTVYSESTSKTFSVLPSNGLTIVKTNVAGRKIGFKIECNEKKARISRPFVKMQVLG